MSAEPTATERADAASAMQSKINALVKHKSPRQLAAKKASTAGATNGSVASSAAAAAKKKRKKKKKKKRKKKHKKKKRNPLPPLRRLDPNAPARGGAAAGGSPMKLGFGAVVFQAGAKSGLFGGSIDDLFSSVKGRHENAARRVQNAFRARQARRTVGAKRSAVAAESAAAEAAALAAAKLAAAENVFCGYEYAKGTWPTVHNKVPAGGFTGDAHGGAVAAAAKLSAPRDRGAGGAGGANAPKPAKTKAKAKAKAKKDDGTPTKGGTLFDPAAAALAKADEAVREEVLASGRVRVFCCTWNLHGKIPAEDVGAVVPLDQYHIYCLATQECERSIKASVLQPGKQKYEALMKAQMGDRYVMVRAHAMMAIHTAVFVHKGLLPLLSGVESAAIATGWGDALGNKGCVGISIALGETRFLFAGCHLAAHEGKVGERNRHFHRIDAALPKALGHGDLIGAAAAFAGAGAAAAAKKKPAAAAAAKGGRQQVGAGEGPEEGGEEGEDSDSDSDFEDMPDPDDGVDSSDEDITAAEDRQRRIDAGEDVTDTDDSDSDFGPDNDASGLDALRARASTGEGGYATLPATNKVRASALYDRVFWMGDLNYRIGLPRAEADVLLAEDDYGPLHAADELHTQRKGARAAFLGFTEGPVHFRPTYKFDKKADTYDSSEKQRVPSWTDRILFKANNLSPALEAEQPLQEAGKGGIALLRYDSVTSDAVKVSDHRPVVAAFDVAFDGGRAAARAKGRLEQQRQREQDNWEVKSQVCLIQ